MSNAKDQVQADPKDQVSADSNNNNILGVLEEDDEFEEFTIAGPLIPHVVESNKVNLHTYTSTSIYIYIKRLG